MAGKKASLGSVKSASSTSIQREPSTEDVTVASRPASPDLLATTGAAVDTPGPHAAAEKAQSELEEGKKRKRPELNVKDKAWEGVKRQAMKEMGGMQPSESRAASYLVICADVALDGLQTYAVLTAVHASPETHNDVHREFHS